MGDTVKTDDWTTETVGIHKADDIDVGTIVVINCDVIYVAVVSIVSINAVVSGAVISGNVGVGDKAVVSIHWFNSCSS